MRYRFWRTTSSLLLSALVLSWGGVPSGVRHAHEGGGDSTHQHDDFHDAAHHDHDCDGTYREHRNVSDVSLLADFVLHLHCQFLGMEFSMPASEEPGDNDDGEGTAVPAIVRAMNEEGLTTQAGLSFIRVLAAVTGTPNADVVLNLESAARPPNLVTSIPLCDSARLERSGVLLA